VASAVDDPAGTLPATIGLEQNYPNPFNPTTQIAFDLPRGADVTLTVFDLSGREVSRLVSGWTTPGHHVVSFDGSALATGVYVYRLTTPEFRAAGKMMLLK
jgi:hypothetical protein